MTIAYDPQDHLDQAFCSWLTKHEQNEPIHLKETPKAEITTTQRIACLTALPEFRGWAKLLASPGLQGFTKKVCNHLVAGRNTLPERLFRHTRKEIAEILRTIPPRPAAAIR